MRSQRTATVIALLLLALLAPRVSLGEPQDPSPQLEEAARLLIQLTFPEDVLEEIYSQVAQQYALYIQGEVEAIIERSPTDTEKHQMHIFWYQKVKELMPYSVMEDLHVPILIKHLDLADLNEINRFLESPAGKKLVSAQATMMREFQNAGEELTRRTSNIEWMKSSLEEMKALFPQWFPESAEEIPAP